MSQAEFNNSAPETKTSELSAEGGDRFLQALHQSTEVGEFETEMMETVEASRPAHADDVLEDMTASGVGLQAESISLVESQSATNLGGAIADLDDDIDVDDLEPEGLAVEVSVDQEALGQSLEQTENTTDEVTSAPEFIDHVDQVDQTDQIINQTESTEQSLPETAVNQANQVETNPNDNLEITATTNHSENEESDKPETSANQSALEVEQLRHLLYQTQEKLSLTEQLVERQENLTTSLQARIAELEQVMQQQELEIVQVNCDRQELRNRLKRQKHHNSQLKAALERCLDSPVSLADSHDGEGGVTESWQVTQLDQAFINKPEPAIATTKLEQATSAVNTHNIEPEPFDSNAIEPALESLSEAIAATIAKVTNYIDPQELAGAEMDAGAVPDHAIEAIENPFADAIDNLIDQVTQIEQSSHEQILADLGHKDHLEQPDNLSHSASSGKPRIDELIAFTQSIRLNQITQSTTNQDRSDLNPDAPDADIAAQAQPDARLSADQKPQSHDTGTGYHSQSVEEPVVTYNQSSYNYAGIVAVPRVAAPKFIQDLTNTKVGNSQPAPRISSTIERGDRKSIPSLAAVKLPQFPPLSR
jgi:hypothetical protein